MADGTIYIDTAIDVSTLEKEMKETETAIKKTEIQLDKLIDKQIRFAETGGNVDSRTFKGMEYDIAQTRAQLDGLKTKFADLKAAQAQASTGAGMLQNSINRLKSAFYNLGSNLKTIAKNLPKAIGKSVIDGVKKLGVAARNAAKKILGIGRNAKTSRMSMMKMLGTSLLIGVAFRALMGIFNGLKQGMNNLAQYSSATNKDLSALKSSLTQLKNSFATAFAPILNVVTPILTSFMNTISNVVNRIGMLMAALTGKGTYTKAVAVQEDYAAGLSNTADAAKDAEKAQNSYLSGLDEITRYESNKSSSTGGSGGGQGGGANVSDMFEEVAIDNSIVDLAEILKVKVAEGDWKGVGTIVADKVNSIFSNIDFYELGSNLSKKIINALDVAIGFLQGVDWQMLGNKVADFIAGIDWSSLANRIFEGIGSVLGGIAGFLRGLIEPAWNSVIEWWKENAYEDGQFTIEGLLNGIVDAVLGIGNWIKDNIFTPFIEGFKEAFGIHSPSTVMVEMGKYLMQGLINGIVAKITEIINAIGNLKTKILAKFTEIKDGLLGKYEQMKTDASNFATNVKNKIVSVFDSLRGRISTIWTNIVSKIRGCVNSIIGAINGMISGVISGMNAVIRALNRLNFKIPDWLKYVPGASRFAGKKLGFNISTISAPRIPYLATGAVIPPNAPFMAVLGDQKHGTNIEAPLDTIKQAVAEVIGNNNSSGGKYQFVAQINRRTIFDEVIEEAKIRQSVNGRNPFELA